MRPLILVANDDGIDAAGLQALATAMTELGEVYVVAPLEEQSAVGHSITMRHPVRARPRPFLVGEQEIKAWGVSGTPADCIKIAVDKLVPRMPDLVVSGINHGPNTAVNIIYSGTVSAATEASILGIDAVAFSLCSWRGRDFETAKQVARRVAQHVLDTGLPPHILLNVNIPAVPPEELAGYAITRQARSRWVESFMERMDPFNEPYYWLSGEFQNLDDGPGTDLEAIEQHRVSITPVQHDLTAHHLLDDLRRVDWMERG